MKEQNQSQAQLIKQARLAKGYTQVQLSEMTRISLRSIQRIENAAVVPRLYTLQILAEALDLVLPIQEKQDLSSAETEKILPITRQHQLEVNVIRLKKIIIAIGTAIAAVLFGAAFLSQNKNFPETHFEMFLFWGFVTAAYLLVMSYYLDFFSKPHFKNIK
ncbi:helix-turn-helix domain-containing protein [Flavobacterium reichenbachii]|uniref:helix-turn-helix domain-containing protein n=1 Tax=Flavobacterium reichenbachii TaxID=362418 RepID=UPI0006919F96|nr:helix-turn-helix transcriptional regulator [Flavobacterium reichenbachii]OXB17175.1 transcriptional regulator [Flavobacterium reichenbachii]